MTPSWHPSAAAGSRADFNTAEFQVARFEQLRAGHPAELLGLSVRMPFELPSRAVPLGASCSEPARRGRRGAGRGCEGLFGHGQLHDVRFCSARRGFTLRLRRRFRRLSRCRFAGPGGRGCSERFGSRSSRLHGLLFGRGFRRLFRLWRGRPFGRGFDGSARAGGFGGERPGRQPRGREAELAGHDEQQRAAAHGVRPDRSDAPPFRGLLRLRHTARQGQRDPKVVVQPQRKQRARVG